MNCTIKHSEESNLGRKRKSNEDNFIALEFSDMPHLLVLGAIDGVGGYAGGEIAAQLCKDTVENFLKKERKSIIENPLKTTLTALQVANNTIYEARKESEELQRMSCVATITLLDKENERLYFAHVGDSRGYVYRSGELIKFTDDHSMVGILEAMGELTEEAAMLHPRRNEVSKLMGEKITKAESTYIQSGEYSFYNDDIVLLCTDGLTDLVDSKTIVEILQETEGLDRKKDKLIAMANEKGGKDNITVALAKYTKKQKQPNKTIEVETTLIEPFDDQILVEEISENKMSENKKKENTTHIKKTNYAAWGILFLIGFLTGFSLNWEGMKYWISKYINTEETPIEIPIDTNEEEISPAISTDTVTIKKDTTNILPNPVDTNNNNAETLDPTPQ